MAVLILCLSGCGRKVTDEQGITALSEMNTEEEAQVQGNESTISSSDGENDSFVFQYQDISETILLKDCDCEYEKDGVRVYSKCMTGYYDVEDFPRLQYALYIMNTYVEPRMLFPVKDFQICEESGVVYLVREEEEFKALQKIDLGSNTIATEDLEDNTSMEQMLIDACKISRNMEEEFPLIDLHFEFEGHGKYGETIKAPSWEEPRKCSSLKGYASGTEKATGKKFYIDYEWDDAAGKEIVSPCFLPSYDQEKTPEAFRECREAFGQIMQGDWSLVTPIKGLDHMWEMGGEEWGQADVNGDGMPELIQLITPEEEKQAGNHIPIELIFAWNGEKVDLVYIDLIDAMDFLFLTDDGQLISEQSTTETPKKTQFTKYHFDEKWILAFEESLSLIYFLDEEDYTKEEAEDYKDRYYRTFGIYGGGLFYQKECLETNNSSSTVREQLSHNQFLSEYYQMTGHEFLEDEHNVWLWEEEFQNAITEERFYDYEIITDDHGEKYVMLKGIREKYKENPIKGLKRLNQNGWECSLPEQLEGIPVTEIADGAFQNIPLGNFRKELEIPSGIVSIGEHCFENCGLSDVIFRKRGSGGNDTSGTLTVGDSAFADNPELWGIYFNDRETSLGETVFDNCGEKVYLCYRKGAEERADYFKGYASEKDIYAVEIPAYYSEVPIVDYQEEPLTLTPDVRNFFYGENAGSEEKGRFCSFEYADDAPDYGFPEWHLPCGEFCPMIEGPWSDGITASSELASPDGRYAPENLHSNYGRDHAWAEGVEGSGIGESICITSCCSYQSYQSLWDWCSGYVGFSEGDIEPDICDGYMRYTEICVVNGYAKNQTLWEENGRVKRLLMYVENKPYAYLELEDTIYPQYFILPVDAIKAADGVDVHFQFVIEDVYPGTKYEDTCLTGLVVEFMGRHGP